jgi:hypothetical protein
MSPTPDLERTFKGRYNNSEYGYELVIPSGLIGKNSPPPAADNGFRIEFPGKSDDSISVYAEYNPLFLKDDEAALHNEIDNIRRDDPRFTILKKERGLLGGESSIRILVQYRSQISGELRIVDEIVALRTCLQVDSKIVYVVSLDTPKSDYELRLGILNSLVGSWKMLVC